MAVSINKTIHAGNLTRNPDIKFFANERCVANFSIACNRRWRGSDGETKEEVDYIDIECWGRTAELVGQYLTKGRPVFVEGRLRLKRWETSEGQQRSKLIVMADNVQFMGSNPLPKSGAQATGSPAPAPSSTPAAGGGNTEQAFQDDEPPF